MQFRKRSGQPEHIEKGPNPIHSSATVPAGIPTRLNTELGKYDWLALVHRETRTAGLHRETLRLVHNLADGRMKFEIPAKTELAAAKEDGYSPTPPKNAVSGSRKKPTTSTNLTQDDSEEQQRHSGKSNPIPSTCT